MKKRQKRESTKSSESSDKPEAPFTSSNDSPSSKVIQNSICRYLIENGHDFSVAASPSFKRMIKLCSGKVRCAIPTVKELKGSIFNDIVKEMDDYVSDIKSSWADTGCSVLLDEWADPKGRSLMNVLVDCPKGAIYLNSYDVSDIGGDINAIQNFFEVILREIGISNVVQVVTNSTSSITNEFRMQLTDKFRSVFWTLSASCCIELMLEKISAIDRIKETLDEAKIISGIMYSLPSVVEYLRDRSDGHDLVKRFRIKSAIPFLVLENIMHNWLIYPSMRSMCTSTEDGKKVVKLLSDNSFRDVALTAFKSFMPLFRVITTWMYDSDNAEVGCIYETIHQAKEMIKQNLLHKKSHYMPYWDIIDDVWSERLHSPLHSAGYFLNPNLFYKSDFAIGPRVVTGLLCCVVRSTKDLRVQDKVVLQIEQYRNAKGCFSEGQDAIDRNSIPPVEWWSKYGKDCPELQRLAIRILSQTCDGASKFRLDRNLAETLLTTEEKGRNPSEQKMLREMTYLRYNMMLQNYESGEISNAVTFEEYDTLC